jgi:hypothetical protein
MALRSDKTDVEALVGAYALWLQRLALGAHINVYGGVIFPEEAPVGPLHPRSAGPFLSEARSRGWVERGKDRDWYISEKGREALAAYKAVHGEVDPYERFPGALAEPSNEG